MRDSLVFYYEVVGYHLMAVENCFVENFLKKGDLNNAGCRVFATQRGIHLRIKKALSVARSTSNGQVKLNQPVFGKLFEV